MYDVQGDRAKRGRDLGKVLGAIWADVSYAHRRAAELNRPWLRTRRHETSEH